MDSDKMKTTLQELLDKIKSREWQITDYGTVRCSNGLCPILAAVHELALTKWMDQTGGDGGNGDYNEAAELIGLAIDCQDFVAAVDNDESHIKHIYKNMGRKRGSILRTRRRVMKALGLIEQRSIYGIPMV